MSQFTADDLTMAVARTMQGGLMFPLVEDGETARVLQDAALPALEDLPPHHNCEVVRMALEAMFVMGVAAGLELGRGE